MSLVSFRPRGRRGHDIRSEIHEVTESMKALLDGVAGGSHEYLSADEQSRWEAYSSQLEQLKADLEQAEAHEARQLQLAQAQTLIAGDRPRFGALMDPERTKVMQAHSLHRTGPLRAFSQDRDGLTGAYAAGLFLRAVNARSHGTRDEASESRLRETIGYDIRATATEGTPGAGGYLVPAPLSAAIIDIRAKAGISRQLARVMPMTAETLSVPKKVAGTTVYYVGEAQPITPSDQTWAQLELSVKKRAVLSYISNELADDALISISDDWAAQVGTDFAVKEDAEFINGDGTSTYGGEVGLLGAIGSAGVIDAAAGHDTWAELDLADFTGAIAAIPDRFTQYPLSWICSSTFYHSVMLRLMVAAGGSTMREIEQGAASRPLFLGYPVYFTNQMPTATAAATVQCLFGAFSQAVIIGSRKEIDVRKSEHAAFENDVLALRAVARYDILVHEGGDASNVGAYVALKTAS